MEGKGQCRKKGKGSILSINQGSQAKVYVNVNGRVEGRRGSQGQAGRQAFLSQSQPTPNK